MAATIELHASLAAMRPLLLQLARARLRNDAWAEDAVSETMLAVLEGPHRFEARSKLQTWIVGILKHKIIDQLRRQARQVSLEERGEIAASDAELDALHAGLDTAALSADRCDPEAALVGKQFYLALRDCAQRLPEPIGRAFALRTWFDYEIPEICAELNISVNHCHVLLYRARARLRKCVCADAAPQRSPAHPRERHAPGTRRRAAATQLHERVLLSQPRTFEAARSPS